LPPANLKRRIIAGRPLVVWRTQANEVVALDARCAHKRFPLWDGRLLDNGHLECGYHGFAFDSSGQCVAIPALHDASDRILKSARQIKYPVVEQQGLVWVWTGDVEKTQNVGIPQTPEINGDGWETRNTEQILVKANYRLLIKNLFDLTHFYPLHAGNIGSLADARVPVEIERGSWAGNPTLKTIRRRAPQTIPPTTAQRFGIDFGEQLQLHEMVGPGLFQVHVTVAPEGKLGTDAEQGFVLYQTITPESEDSLIWRRPTSCRAGSK
jgi:phenylpropionate dioxygenase-like ring-hydroxylating dioxygenase large terminal subunit